MIEAERRGITLSGVSQGCGDSAPSAGQQGSDEQALDLSPSGRAEETLKGCQGGAKVRGRGHRQPRCKMVWVETTILTIRETMSLNHLLILYKVEISRAFWHKVVNLYESQQY